jgi:hypothetical protein
MKRVLHFGDSAALVEARGDVAERLVRFAFSSVKSDGRAQPHTAFVFAEEADAFVVSQDGVSRVFERAGDALEHLVGECTRELVERAAGGLALHAAAVAGAGGLTLLGGASGAGKTTLTAWLLTRGYAYLTDELVWVAEGSAFACALTRPLSVKSGAVAAVANLCRESDARLAVAWSHGVLYDPRAFGEVAQLSEAPIARLVFPTFERGARFRLERLSEGSAAHEVLGIAANARNVPRHGLGEAARLARSVPAYRLVYGAFDDLGPFEARLAAREPE